jgi:GMP synthase (glutamine-hydrolysing)
MAPQLLRNFTHLVCGCTGDWTMGAFRAEMIAKIRAQVGKGRVVCGLSGGVDSSVAAVLIHEAIGDQLTCIYVDHGLMRANESEQVVAPSATASTSSWCIATRVTCSSASCPA